MCKKLERLGEMDFILMRHYIIVRYFSTFHSNPAGEITKSYCTTNACRRQFICNEFNCIPFLLLQAFVLTIVVN